MGELQGRQHGVLVGAVLAGLTPDGLTRQVRPKRTAASFNAMICCHVTWYAGTLKQTRRLC
ncbi:MAG: hypothetical protein M5U25_03125 [Planctomycetota bacterium]|nr:hypothetical protein [Planctomycetota bacterium]